MRWTLTLVLAFMLGMVGGGALMQRRAMPPGATPDGGTPDGTASAITSVLLAAMEDGPARALNRLDSLAGQVPSVLLRSHEIAHAIGQIAIAARDNDPAVIVECTQDFASGCYHGVVQRYMASRGGVSPGALQSICAPLRAAGTIDYTLLECAHGVGHGLSALLEHDLIATLATCDALAAGAARWCYSGAFMENLANASAESMQVVGVPAVHAHGGSPASDGNAAQHTAHFEHIRRDDPAYPCNAVAPRYREECWKYQPVVALMVTGNDFAAAASVCASQPEEHASDCFEGFGIHAAGLNPDDTDAVWRRCSIPQVENRTACLVGAADYFFAVNLETPAAFAVCARAAAGASDTCYARIGERLALAWPDTSARAAECAKAGPTGVAACRAGTGFEDRR